MSRLASLTLVAVLLGGCSFRHIEVIGKACDTAHPCPSGLACLAGVCSDATALDTATHQNTVGASTVFPEGVPEERGMYGGKSGQIGEALPPSGFTAMTGWAVMYPQRFAQANTSSSAKAEFTGFETYVHLVSGGWALMQQQGADNLEGAYYVADFANDANIPWSQTNLDNDVTQIGIPPTGYNALFWPTPRGTYVEGTVNGVFTRIKARVTDPATNVVVALGADWWRDETAPYLNQNGVQVNNPGVGISNWTKLSTIWQPLYFYSLSDDQFRADPPPFD